MAPLVFMVAEKPALAQSLSKILSNNQCATRKTNHACNVYEWDGNFQNSHAFFRMTSVCGHVFSLDFHHKFNKCSPKDLFQALTVKKEANEKLHMPDFLARNAKNAAYLVLWLDCDKEGENICFEVIDCVQSVMRPISSKFIFRAQFSSITDKDIKAAIRSLGEPNMNESRSVDARQELDLKVGCAFTRFQTHYFQDKYGDLDSSVVSFGPCQTPTLGFCVERHDFIQTFNPEPYWKLDVTLQGENSTLKPAHNRGRIFDREKATTATVVDVKQSEKTKPRPLPLNTVELMRVASSGLGMSPHHAMQVAEHLYTSGYISYPRTETTQYATNFDIRGALRLQKGADWGKHVEDVLSNSSCQGRKGHDAGDHPPITPTAAANRSSLTGDSWRLYEFIAKHFIASVARDCRYMSSTINFDIEGEQFSITGRTVIDEGFTSILNWQTLNEEILPQNVKKNSKFSVTQVVLSEHKTTPPKHLTESELISLMEKHGIGTDASIPVHIKKICDRNYVTVDGSSRTMVPTNLGVVLVRGYKRIDPQLVLPTMRSAVEKQLNLIALGKESFSKVLAHFIEIYSRKFIYFVSQIMLMDELFEVSFTTLSQSGRPFVRCGRCKRYLRLVETRPPRLHCSNCNETLALPPLNEQASIKPFHEGDTCPFDEYELAYYSCGDKRFVFCPYCFNHPPFEDMGRGGSNGIASCIRCSHPTCDYSLTNLSWAACSNCENGQLAFDLNSSPQWRLVCNKCFTQVRLFKGAERIRPTHSSCSECSARLFTVVYKESKTVFADGALQKTGCLFCEDEFQAHVQLPRAAVITKSRGFPRGRGRSGRRGRGFRSRGR